LLREQDGQGQAGDPAARDGDVGGHSTQ
jgi:hypothetical protein